MKDDLDKLKLMFPSVKQWESKAIKELREVFRGYTETVESTAGFIAALGAVLVYTTAGCMKREEATRIISETVNRALKTLPSDEEIRKIQEEAAHDKATSIDEQGQTGQSPGRVPETQGPEM